MKIGVSGIGLVTPLGSSREKTWRALIDGRSAIQKTADGYEARIYDFSPNGARSRMGDFAILAAAEALRHAGIDPEDIRGSNIGCAVSQSKPIIHIPAFEKTVPFPVRGTVGLDASLVLSSFFGWSSESVVAREFGLEGPSSNVIAACATGVASIQLGVNWITSGQCDIALVGAAESSLNSFYRAGFRQMGVLTDELPKPFDRDRSGFVMGEGAAVLVLESEASLKKRAHTPVAYVLNTVLRQSTADILRFDPSGDSVAELIRQCVRRSETPDYINAHGTGTVFNDLVETRGIKKAFGAGATNIAVSSTKAATGHLLGAAGAAEAAIAVLAVRDHVVPPTLN